MAKLYYSFDPVSKAFVQEGEALESPEEPGLHLLPANATFVPPPTFIEGQHPVWNGTSWDIVQASQQAYVAAVVGWLATPDEKADLIHALEKKILDDVSKAFGFDDIKDAVAQAGVSKIDSQLDQDAIMLRTWRSQINTFIESEIATVVGNHLPMPTAEDIQNRMPKFTRTIYMPPLPANYHAPTPDFPKPILPDPNEQSTRVT